MWRRRWDSNPRYGFPYGGFQDRCLKPLDHSSVGVPQRRPDGVNFARLPRWVGVSRIPKRRCPSHSARRERRVVAVGPPHPAFGRSTGGHAGGEGARCGACVGGRPSSRDSAFGLRPFRPPHPAFGHLLPPPLAGGEGRSMGRSRRWRRALDGRPRRWRRCSTRGWRGWRRALAVGMLRGAKDLAMGRWRLQRVDSHLTEGCSRRA